MEIINIAGGEQVGRQTEAGEDGGGSLAGERIINKTPN